MWTTSRARWLRCSSSSSWSSWSPGHLGHPGHPDHPAHLLHHQVVNIQEDLAGYRAALEQVFSIVNCHYCQNCHVPHICRFSSTSQIVAEYFSSTATMYHCCHIVPLANILDQSWPFFQVEVEQCPNWSLDSVKQIILPGWGCREQADGDLGGEHQGLEQPRELPSKCRGDWSLKGFHKKQAVWGSTAIKRFHCQKYICCTHWHGQCSKWLVSSIFNFNPF